MIRRTISKVSFHRKKGLLDYNGGHSSRNYNNKTGVQERTATSLGSFGLPQHVLANRLQRTKNYNGKRRYALTEKRSGDKATKNRTGTDLMYKNRKRIAE